MGLFSRDKNRYCSVRVDAGDMMFVIFSEGRVPVYDV